MGVKCSADRANGDREVERCRLEVGDDEAGKQSLSQIWGSRMLGWMPECMSKVSMVLLCRTEDGVGAYSFTACHVRRASRAQIMVDADQVAEGGEKCDEMAGWVRNKGVVSGYKGQDLVKDPSPGHTSPHTHPALFFFPRHQNNSRGAKFNEVGVSKGLGSRG